MDYEELFEKYQALLTQISNLTTENKRLKAQLGIFEQQPDIPDEIIENKTTAAIHQIKCAECSHKSYEGLTEKIIEDHLKGNIIVGLYPMGLDETCRSLKLEIFDK